MEKPRIIIIEDKHEIARFLELELNHEGYAVDMEFEGRAGLKKVQDNDYDLVLLDVLLPGLNGIEVLRRVRQFTDIPVIILTARNEVIDKVVGLDTGADDYITKPFAVEELLARIRVVLRKKYKASTTSKILKISDLTVDIAKRTVVRRGIQIDLTKKEFELLEILIKNSNNILTREQILQMVWGYDYFGDTNVVDVYIRYLRSKIDDPFDNKLIHTVRGVGFILKEELGGN